MLLAIVAWYGLAFVGGEWTLVGPYAEREACSGVVEWLETQGIETESCTMLGTGVEAILLQIGERP
jgi:hypothetical protein